MAFLGPMRCLGHHTPRLGAYQLRLAQAGQTALPAFKNIHIHRFHSQQYFQVLLKPQNLSPLIQTVRTYAKKGKKEKKEKGGKTLKGSKPKVTLTKEELNEVINYDKMCQQMSLAIEALQKDYIQQLTVRTNAGVINQLQVETPDGKFPLIQLGQVTQKTPQLVVVNLAASPQYLNDVKTSIMESGMNLNPQQDGTTLFVPLPKVTKEHRESLAKNAKLLCTKAKDKLRDIHNHFSKDVRKKKDNFSSDLVHNVQEYIDAEMKEHINKAEVLMEIKQKELLQES